MTLQQFLLILRARADVALFTLIATVLTTIVVSLLLPKQYTASTAVVVDVKSPDPVAGMVLPGLVAPGYMATQVDIINSERVALRVVELLKMDQDPGIREQWVEATGGRGKLDVWVAGLMKRRLEVRPSRDSNVIEIRFTGNDAAFSAAVANAFAQAYIDVNLELKIEPARHYATWFEEQTRLVRDKLETAQRSLSAYQQKTGIVASDERVDHETAKLNEISSQLTALLPETADSRSKRDAGNSETLAEVMQSPVINALKADIARLDAKLQESSVNLGRNHPQTQRTESEIAAMKARLDAETRRITAAIATTYQVGRQKEKALRGAMDMQKTRVLELNRQRDELSVLRREVESAQRAFEAVSQRAAQTRLESLSIQTNVVTLNPAAEPFEPSHPRVLLNVLVSVFLGSLLGVAFALLLELRDRRIRSPADLAEAVDAPLLAAVASGAPPSPRGWPAPGRAAAAA